MNWKKTGMFVLFVILLIPFPQVAAQNSQGLYWAVSEDARIDYHYYSSSPEYDPVIDTTYRQETEFDVYAIVNILPDIPDTINPATYTPPTYVLSFYFTNDTAVDSSYTASMQPIFPIGNWSLYTEKFLERNSTLYQYTTSEDLSIWEYTISQNIHVDDDVVLIIQTNVQISKGDGIVNVHSFSIDNLRNDTFSSTIQITRTVFPIVPIAIGAMIVVEATIAFVIYKKFKGRERKPKERKVDANIEELLKDL